MLEMIRCWLSRKQNYDYRGRDMERGGRLDRKSSRSNARPRVNCSNRECFYCHGKGHFQYHFEKMKADLEY